MSYFHGVPITNINTHVGCTSGKKHIKRVNSDCDNERKLLSKCRHRKSTTNNKKLKTHTKEILKSAHYNESSHKTKRELCKEVQRLAEENRHLLTKLKESDPTTIMSDVNEKEALYNKLRSKYRKLEKNYNESQMSHDILKQILEECKGENKQLNIRLQETLQFMSCLEREREDILSSINILKTENNRCNEDIGLLKNVIYQLNVELERYQDKLRAMDCGQAELLSNNYKTEDISRNDEAKRVSESWGKVNIHALGPLLDAYSESLKEKEELITRYKHEMNIFSGYCKEIVHENDILHKSVESIKDKCNKYTEDVNILEEDNVVIKEKNSLLLKQVAVQKQKLQEIHSVYEQKVESMFHDNNKLRNEYLICKTELSNIKGKYEILNESYEKLKINNEKTIPVSVHAAAVEDCKRIFEELKVECDSEKHKLNVRIKTLEENHQEVEKLLVKVTAERDQLKQQLKTAEKQLKRISCKIESVQNTASAMQISRDLLKRQLSKTTAFCKELVEEQETLIAEKDRLFTLLQEREKETEDIQYLGHNITKRMGTLRTQLKSMQKGAEEQLGIAEKNMKIQESNVDRMKVEHFRELNRLKSIISQKDDLIQKLQDEKFSTRDNLELILKAANNDGIKVKDALKRTSICNM